MTPRLSTRFLGVAVVSLATLVLELTLTRLFSATMFYHFAFLAISLALFGSGASGVFVYAARPSLDDVRAGRLLGLASALFSVTTVVALVVILSHPLSPVMPGPSTLVSLAWIYGAAALPFFFSGCVITLAITAWASRISRLYLFDLAGAAAGCLVLVPTLTLLGAIDTVLLVSVLAALGGWLVSRQRYLLPLAGLAAALLAWNAATGTIALKRSKGLSEEGVVFSRWNSFSRVTVAKTDNPDRMLIFIDSDAATILFKDASNLDRHRELADQIESLAYHLGGRDRVLIIGPGGGVDVIIARLLGASDVTAVEVNPLVAREVMSREPFLSFSGHLYEQRGVRLVVDEGRSFLRRSGEQYDLIVATMVDTWAATAAGAFALSENNLYTVEAFSDYLERLAPDGILSMTRWHQEPPDQLLRLVSLGRTALARSGVRDPSDHFIVVRGVPAQSQPLATATVLLKKSAFTPAEVERAEAFARRLGLEVLYSPGTRPENDIARLVQTDDPAAMWRTYESNIAPPTDDSPFFFQSVRLERMLSKRWARGEWRRTNLGTLVLFGLVGITLVVVVAFILGPLLLLRGRLTGSRRGRLSFLLYFAALGVGFIVVEVVLVQKCVLFLGHPAHALTVVLFSILLFSGLGSLLSGRLREGPGLPASLSLVLLAVAGMIGLAVLVLHPLFYGLVHLATVWRVLITVAVLAPLGLVLGMPMPTGIRILHERAPELIPWAWGVNGAASVLGSVGAVALAMVEGFDRALLLAALLYLVALLLVRRAARVTPPAGE